MAARRRSISKKATSVNPQDGVQLELFKTELQSPAQTVWINFDVQLVTGFSRKQRVKPLSPKPWAMIVQFLKPEQVFIQFFQTLAASLPEGWDRDKNGKKTGGGAKRERLFRIARENGWIDFRL